MRKALFVVVLTLALVSCGDQGPYIELPPPPYDKGQVTAMTWYVSNPNGICETFFGDLPGSRQFRGCYVPAADMIVMPETCDPITGPVGDTCERLYVHELGHARGWRHEALLRE